MKIKDLERTASIAWSPANLDSIYLTAGTAAQQLDASFSTNASLEIFSLNLSEPGMDLEPRSCLASENRFHKVVWGSHGADGSGTIVGGCDDGVVQVYNAAKLLRGEDALVARQDKHIGPVHALDFNPFQMNLLATGASESEINIWDMNNMNAPMSPGAKSQPVEDVLCIQWNRQVQHILASTFSSKCVVWDLRKNEPIIKLSDTVSRIRWKVVAWHPEVATQLCLASEEDQAPIIQLWDLRFATSPLKTMENHQRGVLSIAWCNQDPDLLISCAKDNRIVCWNPNSNQPGGEVLSEVAKTNQWNFDISWCPKNPALIATPGFDGHVSIYSLMGGQAQQIQTTNKIADSFPGMEGYVQAPVQQNVAPVSVDLSKPPKWLKKPVGAKFGFGGKLFTFINDKAAIAQAQQNMQPGQTHPYIPRVIYMSQVITETDLLLKSTELEQALEFGNFIEYCKNKADSTDDQHKKYIWHFLKASFEQNPRAELLNLLGYKIEDVNAKLAQYVEPPSKLQPVDALTDQFISANRIDDFSHSIHGETGTGDFILPPQPPPKIEDYKIETGDDTEGLIAQALLLNNIEAAVDLCLQAKKFADAIIIAMTGGSELLSRTQNKYLQQCDGYVSALISALVKEDWNSVIYNCDIGSWKEALAAALTHASDEDLPKLCESMGSRLERSSGGDKKMLQDAQLCYICAGSFERLVASWSGKAAYSNDDLQELVELITFLQKSVERQGRFVNVDGALAALLTKYAFILASQGSLKTALNYLGASADERVVTLKERLIVALGEQPVYSAPKPRSRHNTARSSITSFTHVPPVTYTPGPTFTPTNFNTGLPNSATQQPWQQMPPQNSFNQTGRAFSPAPVPPVATAPMGPPISQPPRPGSVGSAHGGPGLPRNTKRVVDPSVQSNHYGSRSQYPAQVPSSAPQTHNFQTNALSNAPSNPYAPITAPGGAPYMPGAPPTMPGSFPGAVGSFSAAPFTPSHNAPPAFQPTTLVPEPLQATEAREHVPSAMNMLPTNAAPGWNDPPMYNKTNKIPPLKPELLPQSPITHPIFGQAPVQQGPTNGYVNQQQQQQQQQFNPYGGPQDGSQMFQPPPPTSFNPGFNQQPAAFNNQPVNPTNFNTQAVNQDKNQNVQEPEYIVAPVQKKPIPEEHIHMQTVLNELKGLCITSANNPQTKRKIEDVGKKLETLYDLLREHKLAPNTLSSLHQMVQLIQNGDYQGGLMLHTQLVSGPDFSQIASFMPGLKVLLQCALQLQVYLR